jgi:uncharacterized protein GlcG (DUF336 family)
MSILKRIEAAVIVERAIALARERDLAPLAIAVLDAGGHLVAFQREDGAGFARHAIACGKAWGSLGMGFGSRELARRAATAPAFIAALTAATHGQVIPSPGGVLILDADRELLGAVGISGDSGDNDEACAVAGIEAAGFSAIPGAREG